MRNRVTWSLLFYFFRWLGEQVTSYDKSTSLYYNQKIVPVLSDLIGKVLEKKVSRATCVLFLLLLPCFWLIDSYI